MRPWSGKRWMNTSRPGKK